jgi:magnesium transporter
LTLLAGIYGMNFQHMPGLGWKSGYQILLGLMALVVVAQLIYLKHRGWFD